MNEKETITEVKSNVKLGYEYLREMCAFNADFTAFSPRKNPITNRVEYIRFQLERMGLTFELDRFDARNPEKLNINAPQLVNVYVLFKAEHQTENTLVFLAHHDVNNKESENCQDNTASVCNLLHLCGILKDKKLQSNILVAFTDAEEIVSPATCGAKRLSILCNMGMFGKVKEAINLELTGSGEHLWVSTQESRELAKSVCEKYRGKVVQTPYNDSPILERNGIKSVCIGILTERDMLDVARRGYCRTWALCHQMNDTIDKANEIEMKRFVENVLVTMASE